MPLQTIPDEALSRPMLLLAMGHTAELTAQRVFTDATTMYGGQIPYHLAWARLESLVGDGDECVELRVFCRDASAESSVPPFDDLDAYWRGAEDPLRLSPDAMEEELEAVAERLLDEAAHLCGPERRSAAIDQDERLAFEETPPDIVLLIDDENPRWWHWAMELGRQCLLGHRVLAFVFCRWPLPTRDASPLGALQRFRENLSGPVRFSQVYLIGNLNQRGSAIDPEEQIRIVSEYLLDRMWPTGAAGIEEKAQPDWHDPSDDPALHLWSMTHRTLTFDPKDLIEFLRSRAYLNCLSREVDENGEQASVPLTGAPDRSPLAEVARAVLTPNPGCRAGGSRTEAVRWPVLDKAGIERRIGDYEQAIWSRVDEQVGRLVPNLAVACSVLRRARADILAVSERLQLDARAADRTQKAHDLDEPSDIHHRERSVRDPRRFRLEIAALLLGLAAVGSGSALGTADMLPLAALAAGVLGLAAVVAFLLSLSCKDRLALESYTVPLELPYNLEIILHARRRLAGLLHRVLASLDRAEEIGRRWQQATALAAEARESDERSLPGLTEEDLERIDAAADPAHLVLFEEIARTFPAMVTEAVHGKHAVDRIFEPLENAFLLIYRFLYDWDVKTLLATARNTTVNDIEAEWQSTLHVPWQVPDQDVAEDPLFAAIVTERPTDSSLQIPSRVRVYKFCLGVDPAAIPRPESPQEQLETSSSHGG